MVLLMYPESGKTEEPVKSAAESESIKIRFYCEEGNEISSGKDSHGKKNYGFP